MELPPKLKCAGALDAFLLDRAGRPRPCVGNSHVADVHTGRGVGRLSQPPRRSALVISAVLREVVSRSGDRSKIISCWNLGTAAPPEARSAAQDEEKFGPGRVEARKHRHKTARFMRNCLLDGNIRSALMRRFRRLPIAFWGAVEVSRLHYEVSLPDPALNGMLWGGLASVDAASPAWLQCNFMGRNEVQTEVRLYPRRLVKAVLSFCLRLPYRALLKQWRAS